MRNVNELPSFTEPIPAVTVSDDVPNGTVLGTVTATDPDGDSLTFSITDGNSDGVFGIGPGTGVLSIADNSNLSYVEVSRYFLTLRVSDGAAADSAVVKVDVTSTNMHRPVIGSRSWGPAYTTITCHRP